MANEAVKRKDDFNLQQHLDFEYAFYTYIAGSDNFELIPVPLSDGTFLSLDEETFIKAQAKSLNKQILYRVSQGNVAIVYTKDLGKIGIIPEDNEHGFPC